MQYRNRTIELIAPVALATMIDEYAIFGPKFGDRLPSFFGVSLSEHLVEIAFDEGLYGVHGYRCADECYGLEPPRSCVSQANATPLPPPCSVKILAASASVDSRAQSRCHSPLRAIQVIGTAPACTIRRTAMSCASTDTPPDASATIYTSYPSPSACMLGIARHISGQTASKTSCPRPR